MKRKSFRPVMDTMEPRLTLSGMNWFTTLIDNFLGKSTPPSHPAPHRATHPAHVQTTQAHTALQLRQERLTAWQAAHPHAKLLRSG